MRKAKHTPGPWLIAYDIITLMPRVVSQHTDGRSELLANAWLISAAPDLYEACELARAALNRHGISDPAGLRIDAALARARGQ